MNCTWCTVPSFSLASTESKLLVLRNVSLESTPIHEIHLSLSLRWPRGSNPPLNLRPTTTHLVVSRRQRVTRSFPAFRSCRRQDVCLWRFHAAFGVRHVRRHVVQRNRKQRWRQHNCFPTALGYPVSTYFVYCIFVYFVYSSIQCVWNIRQSL